MINLMHEHKIDNVKTKIREDVEKKQLINR